MIFVVSVSPRPRCGHAPVMSRLRLPFFSDSASILHGTQGKKLFRRRNEEEHIQIDHASNIAFNPTSVHISYFIYSPTHPVNSEEPETARDWREKGPSSIGQLRELSSHRGTRRRSSGLVVCFSIVSQSAISNTRKFET